MTRKVNIVIGTLGDDNEQFEKIQRKFLYFALKKERIVGFLCWLCVT